MIISLVQVRLPDGTDLGLVPEHRLRQSVISRQVPGEAAVSVPNSELWHSANDWIAGVELDARIVPHPIVVANDGEEPGSPSFMIRPEDGGQLGPMSERRITLLIKHGILRRADLVQRVGSERWREAGKVAAAHFDRAAPVSRGSTMAQEAFSGHPAPDLSDLPSSPPLLIETIPTPPKKSIRYALPLGIAALVAFPLLLAIGIAATQFQRRDQAESAYAEARRRAEEAVRTYAEAVDRRNLQESGSFKLSEELSRVQRQVDRVGEDLGKRKAIQAELERHVAKQPEFARLLGRVRETLPILERQMLIEKIKADEIDSEFDVNRQLLVFDYTRGNIGKSQFERELAQLTRLRIDVTQRLEQALAQFSLARQNEADLVALLEEMPSKEAELSTARDRTQASLQEQAVIVARRDVLAAAAHATTERKAAEDGLTEAWAELQHARAGVRTAALWGAFGGLLLDGLMVGGFLLTRPRKS